MDCLYTLQVERRELATWPWFDRFVFSSDGQFLVVAKATDFVHVCKTKLNYEERQEIDLFGEMAGVSLSPNDETLYIGVSNWIYSSLLQYNKRHRYGYLDSFV
ncbi:putative transcription factor WD40-like family [Helianthus anomalus]